MSAATWVLVISIANFNGLTSQLVPGYESLRVCQAAAAEAQRVGDVDPHGGGTYARRHVRAFCVRGPDVQRVAK